MIGDRAGAGVQTTILLVEDDEAVRELIRKALTRIGSRLVVAGSAAEATAIAAEMHIDLLLTDVVLPGASGIDLAAVLLARQPRLGVIYMTGWEEHSALAAIPDGVPVLKKPFDLWELAQAVTTVLG
jgi:DNA-binding NtrC family response regulator